MSTKDPRDANGLSISGAARLERIELTTERTREMVGQLGEEVRDAVRTLRNMRKEFVSLEQRVRSLELRFYGILAGLVTAVGVILWQGPQI